MHEVDQSKLQSPWLMKGPGLVAGIRPGESVGFVIAFLFWLV